MSVAAAHDALKDTYENFVIPSKSVTFTDTYSNITGDGIIDNIGGYNYLVQTLVPGIKYKLRFDIEKKEILPGSGTEGWASKATNLSISAVHGTALTTTEVTNNFFLSQPDADGNQEILFQTTNAMNEADPLNNNINLTTTGFTRNDTSPYLPTLTSGIGDFTSKARYYILNGAGQPSNGTLVDPSPHAYDAYMMIFPNNTVENTNAALTSAFINGNYLKAKTTGGQYTATTDNGIILFSDVNRIEDPSFGTTQITLSDIPITSSALQTKYGTLVKDDQYIVAFMLYDKNSQYIPYYTDSNLAIPRQIKWFRFVMQAAGNWEIYLSQFRTVTNVHANLHSSTAVALNIDGISTVGTPSSGDEYRITIRASPY
jgi:hypothetical protein